MSFTSSDDYRMAGTFESAVVPSFMRISDESLGFVHAWFNPFRTPADGVRFVASDVPLLTGAPTLGISCTSNGVSSTPDGRMTVSALCTLGSMAPVRGGGSESGGTTSESRIESTVGWFPCPWLDDELNCCVCWCGCELRLLGRT